MLFLSISDNGVADSQLKWRRNFNIFFMYTQLLNDLITRSVSDLQFSGQYPEREETLFSGRCSDGSCSGDCTGSCHGDASR